MADLPVPADYTQALGATNPTHSEDHDNIRDKVDDAADDIVTAQADITTLENAKVPVGGTTSQVLAKTGNGDYAMAWSTVGGGGGPIVAADVGVDDTLWAATAADAQEALDEFEARIVVSENDINTAQADITAAEADIVDLQASEVPAGGTTGQVLAKASNADHDMTWDTASGAPTGATYLVATTNASLSAEVVVGATPGGELGGTWDTPTVDSNHAGLWHPTFDLITGADYTNATTSFTETGLLAAMAAGEVWEFMAVLNGKDTGTDGCQFALHMSAGALHTIEAGIVAQTGGGSDAVTGRFSAFDTAAVGPGGGATDFWKGAGEDAHAVLRGIVRCVTDAANFSVRAKKRVSGTLTIYEDSYLKMQRIS